MFLQSTRVAASFGFDLVGRVGRAIGEEARNIGIGACLRGGLDLGLEQRWRRVLDRWGKDVLLTSALGPAFASSLPKKAESGLGKVERPYSCC